MGKEQETQADELDTKIEAAVEKAIAPLVERLSKKATNNMEGAPLGGVPAETPRPTITDVRDPADANKGLNFARYVKAIAVGRIAGADPVEVAKKWGYKNVSDLMARTKAMSMGTFTEGGALVPDEYQADLIELLRAQSVVRRAGAIQIPMGGPSLTMPKQTGGGTAYWGAENTSITPSQQTVGTVQLQAKKLTALTPITNELIMSASIGAEEFVRNDLLNVVALAEDAKFLRGLGDQNAPKGLRYWAAAGNFFTETAGADPATLAEVRADTLKVINKLEGANVRMIRPAWFYHSRVKNFLRGLADGNGNLVFENQIQAGQYYGFPFYVSNQIPTTLQVTGTTNETEITLADMADIIIGDYSGMRVEVFPNGTFNNSGTMVSGISNDLTIVRVIKFTDLIARHQESIAGISDSEWGA